MPVDAQPCLAPQACYVRLHVREDQMSHARARHHFDRDATILVRVFIDGREYPTGTPETPWYMGRGVVVRVYLKHGGVNVSAVSFTGRHRVTVRYETPD